jgi:hypothetical protein
LTFARVAGILIVIVSESGYVIVSGVEKGEKSQFDGEDLHGR